MSASRSYTVVGSYRWRFDERRHVWTVIGLPEIFIRPVVMKARGGRQRAAWVLEPSGETFPDYQDAMAAVEVMQPGNWRRMSRATRRAS